MEMGTHPVTNPTSALTRLRSTIKHYVRNASLRRWQCRFTARQEIAPWEEPGRLAPRPAAFKRPFIRQVARRLGTFLVVFHNTIRADLLK